MIFELFQSLSPGVVVSDGVSANDLLNNRKISLIDCPMSTDHMTHLWEQLDGNSKSKNKYIISSAVHIKENPNPEDYKLENLLDPEHSISIKFGRMFKLIKLGNKKSFIHTSSVGLSSPSAVGIVPELAKVLLANGFEEYLPQSARMLTERCKCAEPSEACDKCLQKKQTFIRDKLSDTKRFIIVHGSMSVAHQEKLLAEYNHPENIRGEYIQVIIASDVLSEGYDFSGIRQMHLITPNSKYSVSAMQQIIGRGIRASSHVNLPPKEQNISIYAYASTYSTDFLELRPIISSKTSATYIGDKQKELEAVTNLLKNYQPINPEVVDDKVKKFVREHSDYEQLKKKLDEKYGVKQAMAVFADVLKYVFAEQSKTGKYSVWTFPYDLYAYARALYKYFHTKYAEKILKYLAIDCSRKTTKDISCWSRLTKLVKEEFWDLDYLQKEKPVDHTSYGFQHHRLIITYMIYRIKYLLSINPYYTYKELEEVFVNEKGRITGPMYLKDRENVSTYLKYVIRSMMPVPKMLMHRFSYPYGIPIEDIDTYIHVNSGTDYMIENETTITAIPIENSRFGIVDNALIRSRTSMKRLAAHEGYYSIRQKLTKNQVESESIRTYMENSAMKYILTRVPSPITNVSHVQLVREFTKYLEQYEFSKADNLSQVSLFLLHNMNEKLSGKRPITCPGTTYVFNLVLFRKVLNRMFTEKNPNKKTIKYEEDDDGVVLSRTPDGKYNVG